TDILVIAALADASTASVIDAKVFDALPTRAFVVNIARGSLIDEPALIAALRAHSIAGAALDVQEIEPVPADHPLWSLENLVLTPHTAGAGSNGTGATHAGRFTANLDRWLAGKPLEQVVIGRT
ncbi:MAG: hypothetical protein FJX29_04410, partial [Alphaproteobacteria bacterium]|nr:hypothetical protein [Alphaproteobacteria bacterium]